MRRRDFLKGVAGLAGGLALGSTAQSGEAQVAASAAASGRPNFLIITADDLGQHIPACFGGKTPDISPSIDQFAKQGIRFRNAFVTVPVCQPSRSVMITGRYPARNGAVGFNPIVPGVPMLGEQMRKAGYMTGLVQKVSHFEPVNDENWDYVMRTLPRHGRDPKVLGEEVTKFAGAAKSAGKPFCMIMNVTDPHDPMSKSPQETQAYRTGGPPDPSRLYKPEEVEVPGYLPDTPEVRQELVYYYNSCKRCDDSFGALLAALDATGRANDTVVMFLGDNGAQLPFSKQNLYLQGVRTPWIVRWPGHVKPDSFDEEHFINGIDLMPTILDMAGAPLPAHMNGLSIVPLLEGKNQPNRDRAYVVYDRAHGDVYETRAIHTKQYGYIYNHWANGKNLFKADNSIAILEAGAERDPEIAKRLKFYNYRTREEFYDYSRDPHSLHNLVGDPAYDAPLKQMRRAMRDMLEETGDPNASGFGNYVNLRDK